MMKDSVRDQVDRLLERKAARLKADDPEYLALIRLEMSFVDQMRRIYTLAKRVAKDLEKLVRSALANAQQQDPNLDVDQLRVSRACVDEAPPLKRSRHQSMGRVFPVLKRACHVTVGLDIPAGGGRV